MCALSSCLHVRHLFHLPLLPDTTVSDVAGSGVCLCYRPCEPEELSCEFSACYASYLRIFMERARREKGLPLQFLSHWVAVDAKTIRQFSHGSLGAWLCALVLTF